MKPYLERLRQASDFLFVTGLAMATLLGSKVTPLLVVAGVLPIPFLLQAVRDRRYHVRISAVLVPFGLYVSYSLVALFLFTGLDASDPRPVNPSLEFYVIAIAMFGIGLIRALQIENLAFLFRKYMPWLLVACFLALSFLMFAGIRDACRVRGLAAWPFIPALLFSTLTLICLVGWDTLASRERWLRVGLLALSVVVSTTFTGSRGIAVAQVGVFGLLLILGFFPSLTSKIPRWYHVISAALVGAVLSLIIGTATDCGPASRFSSTFETLEAIATPPSEPQADIPATPAIPSGNDGMHGGNLSEEPAQSELSQSPHITADHAIADRLAMWRTSVEAIGESPIFGHGSLYLQKLISAPYGHQHNHNQYLTWLVTGGIVQLALGLFFLATPWFVSRGLSLADRILLTAAVSVFWGLSLMFDSFLNQKFFMHYFCLLCGVLYALSNSLQEGEPT